MKNTIRLPCVYCNKPVIQPFSNICIDCWEFKRAIFYVSAETLAKILVDSSPTQVEKIREALRRLDES